MKKDIFTLLSGFLVALLGFFTTIGIKFEWFTMDSINAFVLVCSAFVALAVSLVAVWRNNNNGLKEKALLSQKKRGKKK